MTEQAFCPYCGVPQIAGAQFCVKCGQKLPGGPTVQQTAPAASPAAPPAHSAAVTPPAWSQPPAAPPAHSAAVTPPAWSQPPAAPPAPSAAVTPPGWSQQPGVTQPGPYGAPPPPGYYPGGQPHPLVQRPTGIAILAILEVVGGVLCLLVAKALFDYADVVDRISAYYGGGDAGGAKFVGLAYLAASVASFVAAWGLWSIRPWAWLLGCALAAVSVASAVLSLANHGDAVWVVINIGVNAGVLYYLNINEIRALFGRPPSTFMQTRL